MNLGLRIDCWLNNICYKHGLKKRTVHFFEAHLPHSHTFCEKCVEERSAREQLAKENHEKFIKELLERVNAKSKTA